MQALLGHAHVDSTANTVHLAPTHVKAEFDAARERIRAQQR
jgi:site-specific recombinase XerC